MIGLLFRFLTLHSPNDKIQIVLKLIAVFDHFVKRIFALVFVVYRRPRRQYAVYLPIVLFFRSSNNKLFICIAVTYVYEWCRIVPVLSLFSHSHSVFVLQSISFDFSHLCFGELDSLTFDYSNFVAHLTKPFISEFDYVWHWTHVYLIFSNAITMLIHIYNEILFTLDKFSFNHRTDKFDSSLYSVISKRAKIERKSHYGFNQNRRNS